MGSRRIVCLLGFIASLALTSAAAADDKMDLLELGSFKIGMTYDDWRAEVRTPGIEAIQEGIRRSPTQELVDARRGVQRAYSAASGAMVFIELSARTCGRHLKRVARGSVACGFWFGKSAADRPYRLFDIAVEFERPDGLRFAEVTAKMLDRFGKPAGDHQLRQPATAPPSRFLHWKVRVENSHFAIHFRGRESDATYSLRISANEPYVGATRHGRHLRRTWVRNLSLFE